MVVLISSPGTTAPVATASFGKCDRGPIFLFVSQCLLDERSAWRVLSQCNRCEGWEYKLDEKFEGPNFSKGSSAPKLPFLFHEFFPIHLYFLVISSRVYGQFHSRCDGIHVRHPLVSSTPPPCQWQTLKGALTFPFKLARSFCISFFPYEQSECSSSFQGVILCIYRRSGRAWERVMAVVKEMGLKRGSRDPVLIVVIVEDAVL